MSVPIPCPKEFLSQSPRYNLKKNLLFLKVVADEPSDIDL